MCSIIYWFGLVCTEECWHTIIFPYFLIVIQLWNVFMFCSLLLIVSTAGHHQYYFRHAIWFINWEFSHFLKSLFEWLFLFFCGLVGLFLFFFSSLLQLPVSFVFLKFFLYFSVVITSPCIVLVWVLLLL